MHAKQSWAWRYLLLLGSRDLWFFISVLHHHSRLPDSPRKSPPCLLGICSAEHFTHSFCWLTTMASTQLPSSCYCLSLCICPNSAPSAHLLTLSEFTAEILEGENLTGSAHSPVRQRFWSFVLWAKHLCQFCQLPSQAHAWQPSHRPSLFHSAEAHGCSSGL